MKSCFFPHFFLLPLSALLFLSPAGAVSSDSEIPYPPGWDVDKPLSLTTDASYEESNFKMVNGKGMDGSPALVTTNHSSDSLLFSPGKKDLSGFDGQPTGLNISFSYRFEELPSQTDDEENMGTVALIQFGYDGSDKSAAAVFAIRSNGQLLFYNGNKAITVSSVSVEDTDTWTTVTASLNYAEQTFTFSLNGKSYATAGGTSVFGFRGESTSPNFRIKNQASPHHKSIAFDRMRVSSQPIP